MPRRAVQRNKYTHYLIPITYAVILYFAVMNLENLPGYFFRLLGLITPVLIGMSLAFVFNGPVSAFDRLINSASQHCFHRRPKPSLVRSCSITLTILITLGLLFGIIFLIVPELIKTISSLSMQIPGAFEKVQNFLEGLKKNIPGISESLGNLNLSIETIQDSLLRWLSSVSGKILNQTLSFSLGIFSFLMNLVFGICLALYVLAQKERLGRQSRSFLYAYFKEERVDKFLEVCHLCSQTFSRFITGQLLEAFILGMLFLVAMSIFRFPYAVLISLMIMIFALIPIVGAYVATVTGSLLILIDDPAKVIWFIVMFIVIQQFEGNFIYPRVVGKSVGLSSMWVLIAITVGGATAGVAGMLLSIPFISVLYTLAAGSIHRRLRQKKLPYYKTDNA